MNIFNNTEYWAVLISSLTYIFTDIIQKKPK